MYYDSSSVSYTATIVYNHYNATGSPLPVGPGASGVSGGSVAGGGSVWEPDSQIIEYESAGFSLGETEMVCVV